MPSEGGSGGGGPNTQILAAVTMDRDAFTGNIPIVIAKSEEEQTTLAWELARVMRADVFQLPNNSYILLPSRR